MPGGLLGAISGILAGGILGFGAAEWSVLLDTFAKILHFCWCFVFASLQDPNSEASATLLETSGQGPLLCFCCWWLFLVFLCCFCFVAFCVCSLLFSFGPDLTLDCVIILTPLLTPQSGT